MVKLRKQRRRKVYRHNVNRKKLKNSLYSKGTIVGCKEIKQAWEDNKSVKRNLLEMGLSYDPNVSIKSKTKNIKPIVPVHQSNNGWAQEDVKKTLTDVSIPAQKSKVAQDLLKEARAPRVKLFRLPNGQVEWITYLLDKYGCDYKEMAKDKKNYNQETWKQIRAKIRRFKSIPEQYSEYLAKAGIADVASDKEYDSDD